MKKFDGLNKLMNPSSIAVIGASRDEKSVGYGVLKSLVDGCVKRSPWGCYGFKGKVFAVNPKAKAILGKKCFSDVTKIPGTVDVAVICVPAKIVETVAIQCGQKGVKALIVVSAGFGETGTQGRELEERLNAVCQEYGMRMLGPNCLGLIRPALNYNASFALSSPPAGGVALVTQSGALADSVIDWAISEKYSFSTIASVGNGTDIDVAELIEFLGKDPSTKVITLYLEGVRDGRKLMSEIIRAGKPVVLVKGGRTDEGQKAAASHTGNLAGDARTFEGAMKQAGAIVAESLEEMFDIAKALSEQPKAKSNSVAIVTNGGGLGVLTSDYCKQYGVKQAQLSEKTLLKLDKSGIMHPAYSRRNPLDLVGDALPERYAVALNTLLAQDDIAGAIVIQTVQTMTDSKGDAKAVIEAQRKFKDKPIVCVFMGGKYTAEGIDLLRKNGIPDYNDPKKAVRAFAALAGLL